MRDTLDRIKEQFTVAGHCGMVRGDETLEQMTQIFKAPRGVEHCTKHNLPTIDIIREVKHELLDISDEWYIDSDEVYIVNPEWAILVGDTDATIVCDTNKYACNIVLLHNSRAKVCAKDYSVVNVEQAEGCTISVEKSINAKVIL